MGEKYLLKLMKLLLKCYGPYALVLLSLVFGGKLFGAGYPFVRDKEKEELRTETIYDKDGIVLRKEKYDDFNQDNYISYITSWEEDDSGYLRTVTNYDVSDINIDQILKLLEENSLDLTVIDSYIEKVDFLTEEELRYNTSTTTAHIFEVDKDNYVLVEEEKSKNISTTFIETTVFLFLSMLLKDRGIVLSEELKKIKKMSVDKNEKC